MILSEWKAVWDTAVGVFAREPIGLQLAIGLGGAFLALMVLEGIRANFVPRRRIAPAAPPKPAAAPAPAALAPVVHEAGPPAIEPVTMLSPSPAPRLALPPRKAAPVNRKRQTARPLAHRPMRPKIQAARQQFGEQSNA